MINLSKGSLITINNQVFFYRPSVIMNEINSRTIVLRFNEEPILLQIISINYTKEDNFVSLTLYDGESVLETELDCKKWTYINSSLIRRLFGFCGNSDYNNNNNKISIGTYIILLEYTFKDIVLTRNRGIIKNILHILEFHIIGQ